MATLSEERLATLLAYCKLTELKDDPEVQMLIPVFYASAVDDLEGAGISEPPEGTTRRAVYDLLVSYMVLDAWDNREQTVSGSATTDNPAFRRRLNRLKLTEPVPVSGSDT